MVRAAASGVIDYAGADPTNRQWRLKHRLLLGEFSRRQDQQFIEVAHRHWLALLAHGSLTEESFSKVKETANETLADIQKIVFPWVQPAADENGAKPATILKSDTAELIARYKEITGAKE
jgi:hypothetical protein